MPLFGERDGGPGRAAQKGRTTMTKRFKLQLIVDDGRWPYVGNGYLNKDGSINLVVDQDTIIEGGRRLRLRPAFGKG